VQHEYWMGEPFGPLRWACWHFRNARAVDADFVLKRGRVIFEAVVLLRRGYDPARVIGALLELCC
jgi:hypothetical protein